ncbi:MAG: hypothetical protein R8M45_11330 [Ghiorsea sp.]
MKMLKHKETGIIYGFTEEKASLSIMETVEIAEAKQPKKKAAKQTKASPRPDGVDIQSEIITAIGLLDTADQASFTSTGLPQVAAIEAILGYDITAAERNEANATINA